MTASAMSSKCVGSALTMTMRAPAAFAGEPRPPRDRPAIHANREQHVSFAGGLHGAIDHLGHER